MAVALAALLAESAERGHLDDFRPEHHMGQTESTTDQAAVAEQLLDLVGRRVGGDVEILRCTPEQQIAHGAADQIGGVTSLIQPVQHPQARPC